MKRSSSGATPGSVIYYGTTKTAQLAVSRGLAEGQFLKTMRPACLIKRLTTSGAALRIDGGVVRYVA